MAENTNTVLPENFENPNIPTGAKIGQVILAESASGEAAPSDAERVFASGRMLVRGMDAPSVERDTAGNFTLNFEVIDRETDDMFGRGDEHGLWYASSTLVLPGQHVPTYKNFGFMFDGATADIHHVHEQDSGSSGQGEDFWADKSDLTTLDELAEVIKDSPPVMNEVNATFRADDLKGIFALEARRPTAKINAWFTREHMRQTTGAELPLYVYDIKEGSMTPWNPTADDVRGMVEATFPEKSLSWSMYSQVFESETR